MSSPAWAQPDTSTPAASVNNFDTNESASIPSGAAAATGGETVIAPSSKANLVQRIFSVVTLALCAAMAVTAVYVLLNVGLMDEKEISEAFVGVYMIIFSMLLAGYEIMWWMPVPWVNKSLRKNFGFLYGLKGKAGFIIYVAILNFGLIGSNDAEVGDSGYTVEEFNIVVGFCMLFNGLCHFFIYCRHHEHFETYEAPSAGLMKESGLT